VAPRLAEVVATVSLLTDLGMGEQQGRAVCSRLVATGLARSLGVAGQQLADVYYASLLRHIGCTATAADEAARFRADETAVRRAVAVSDPTSPAGTAFLRTATAAGFCAAGRARCPARDLRPVGTRLSILRAGGVGSSLARTSLVPYGAGVVP
jgi:hypothetical protein